MESSIVNTVLIAIVVILCVILIAGTIAYSRQRLMLKPLTPKSIQQILSNIGIVNEYNIARKTIIMEIPGCGYEVDCNALPYVIFIRIHLGIVDEEQNMKDLFEVAATTMTSELSMVKAVVEKEYIQFYIAAPERNYANLEQNMEFYIQQLIKASQRCREIFDTLKDEISKTECNE